MTDTPEEPTVRQFPMGWHLVEAGGWQVSVAPDGLLMLPRHLHPNEVPDFCAAATKAAEVGLRVLAENAANTTPAPTEEELADTTTIVTEGEPPPGAVKMMVQQRAPQDRSAIGRPRRRDPREPRTHQPPTPPIPGARNGRRKA